MPTKSTHRDANTQVSSDSLRGRAWKRFLRGPDPDMLEELYVPALSVGIGYDRCCAYFNSSVLQAAARGFGKLIVRLAAMGDLAPKPAVRLLVNEELTADDVRAMMETGDVSTLEAKLTKQLTNPVVALEKRRLQMLAWLVKSGLLEVRVGVMRRGDGILHAKFGIIKDAEGDALVFRGSDNESGRALQANYENLEMTTSWADPDAYDYYLAEFNTLWADEHPDVHVVPLPEAVKQKLIRFAPKEAPLVEPTATEVIDRAAMQWSFIAEAPYLPNGGSACDETAMVDLWPHQFHVVDESAAAWPAGRLLCDEVGMGKTIEAMIIMRRLLAGRGVRRLLILTPANLVPQWQGELREKGGMLFPRYDLSKKLVWPNGAEDSVSGLSDALRQDRLIMSRELARLEENRQIILGADPWDLVVLDESHAARRREQIEGEFNSGTLLLDLLRDLQLRRKTRGFLLLSATPMQTAPWEPWDLLGVLGEGGHWLADFAAVRDYYNALSALDMGICDTQTARKAARVIASDSRIVAPPHQLSLDVRDTNAVQTALTFAGSEATAVVSWMRQSSPLSQRMHRNTRATLRRYYELGMLPLPPAQRQIEDVKFDYLHEAERAVYDRITTYIEKRFEELEEEKPGKGFVMTIYRRRAASSPYALQASLKRRRDGLMQVISQRASASFIAPQEEDLDIRDLDDLGELEVGGRPSSALPTSPKEAAAELEQVNGILRDLVNLNGLDSKRDRFIDELRRVTSDGRSVLVFTEYTDTLDYLRDFLVGLYGTQLGCYSGRGGEVWDGVVWRHVTKDQITESLRAGRIQALLCTDAASEGLNLQAAGALINYDLPWNPSKVEQRIGRIDRIGQQLPVVEIVNLFLQDSVDDQVYDILRHRCDLFEKFVGAMQPVLAQARRMLLGKDSVQIHTLIAEAEQVRADRLGHETYAVEHEARRLNRPHAPVSRRDIVDALKHLPVESGVSIKWKGDTVELKAPRLRKMCVSTNREVLERDIDVIPLTPDAEPVRRIVQTLTRSGARYPLVIGTHQDGAFRVSVAYWVGGSKAKRVNSYSELMAYLEEWDGELPEPDRWLTIRRQADEEAAKLVEDQFVAATRCVDEGLNAQVCAAQERLQRELARFLVCLRPGSSDLNMTWHDLIKQGGPTADRLKRVYKRLGGWQAWSGDVVADAIAFHQTLPPNKVKARITGTEVDAALQDPRWKACDAQ